MSEYTLQYHAPAQNFNEALPLGNGALGAMIYGQYPTEKISLNRDDLWSGKPNRFVREGAHGAYLKAQAAMRVEDLDEADRLLRDEFVGPYTASYLPMGSLMLDYADADVTGYCRRLDLYHGVATTSCADRIAEHFISNRYHCMISRISTSKPATVTAWLESLLRGSARVDGSTLLFDGQCPVSIFNGCISDYGNEGVRFAIALRAVTDGRVTARDGKLVVEDATDVVFYLTAESSFVDHNNSSDNNYTNRSIAELDACVAAGYEAIKADHCDYYAKHMSRSELQLGVESTLDDTLERLMEENKGADMVELLFNYGKYLTIASSAPGSRATNLQGIWNEDLMAAWRSNHTVNINTEMNYWHALMCGLTEFHLPIVDLVKTISDTGRTTAQAFYNADGFVCHHNIDLWGNTVAVGGIGEEHKPENTVYSFWCGASGWLCRAVFDYYEYTLDKDYLQNTAYPLMKEAAKFYLDILTPMEDGMLAVFPSTSPENFYLDSDGKRRAIAPWTTMTQSIVQDLLINCVKCCEILGVDEDWKATVEAVIPRLKPFAIGKNGALLEWDKEYTERDPQHRHVSHLYGLYPAELITMEGTPELAQACKRSLEIRGDDGTGWSLAWKACLWARLKDGDHTWKLIQRQLRYKPSNEEAIQMNFGGGTYPNMFDAHPPFQIDGNFGITAAIAMLFLQCENGKIKLLPALPKELDHGSAKGLVAKGNVQVDLTWENYKPVSVVLRSPIAQTVLVEFDGTVRKTVLQCDQDTVISF